MDEFDDGMVFCSECGSQAEPELACSGSGEPPVKVLLRHALVLSSPEGWRAWDYACPDCRCLVSGAVPQVAGR